MESVNYIKHLSGVYAQFYKDNRLNPSHISLYMALFQFWNINRFKEVFYVNRDEVMQFAKIGSRATYHRCIKNLDAWKYIQYLPSHNPYKGSRVRLFNFSTSSEQALGHKCLINEQALVSNINIYKQENINKPLSIKMVLNFFKKNDWPELEANKFFNYYQSIGWIKKNQKIEDWTAAASLWMLKVPDFETRKKQKKEVDQNWDNLHTSRNKDYNQPL